MVENMNKRNYQKELDVLLEHLEQETLRPKLLLHACRPDNHGRVK